jgi:L-ascorbate metabolism protein UlaG (beta-lactamase superfamily)
MNDLPDRIDYVLLTHNHQDHVLLETLIQLRYKIGIVIVPRGGDGGIEDPSLRRMLRAIGFDNVIEIDELERISLPGGYVTALPFFGEHGDMNIRTKSTYVLGSGCRKVMIAADSSNVEPRLYQRLADEYGGVDILFLGMESEGAPVSWLYGPLLLSPLDRNCDHSRRLNGADDAAGFAMVEALRPSSVYVYAMGGEPWVRFISSKQYTAADKAIIDSDRLVNRCRAAGIEAQRLELKKDLRLAA